MQYRHLLLAGLFAHVGVVHAMGLGELDLQSHLGAPLQAKLDLFSPGQFDQQDVRVRIARVDVYDRMGARYEPFHSGIEFSVRKDVSGHFNIMASTKNRVTEPFLDIVVELSWPTGTSYRRYSVLVDPPAYAMRWKQSAPAKRATPIESDAIQLANNTASFQVPVVRHQADHRASEYRVRHGDSLWKIAKHLQADSRQSLHEIMQALYVANPDAFIQGDRNRLKSGASLQLPMLNETSLQQVAQANVHAPDVVAKKSVDISAGSVGAISQDVVATKHEESDVSLDIQAALVSAQQAQHVGVPDNVADIQAAIARLQQEKAELQAFQLQVKDELTGVLEQRIAATEALQQVERLQRTMTHATASASTPVGRERSATSSARPDQRSDNQDAQRQQTQQPPATSKSGVVVREETSPVKVASLSDMTFRDLMETSAAETVSMDVSTMAAHDLLKPAPSFSNRIVSHSGPSLWYLLAMVPLGLLVVLMGMRSHRVQQIRRSEQVKDMDLHELVFGSRRDRTRAESPEQIRQAVSQIREKADYNDKQRLESRAQGAEEGRDDLKQIIDLYLVYSQYQKALNVILTEITKSPGRADLRLYLMQVYAEMGDWTAFDEQEAVLRRLGQQTLLEQALQLRQSKGI